MDTLPSRRDAPIALVLNGALPGDEAVDVVAGQVAADVERLGMRPQSVMLRGVQVAPCLGCFECWTRSPGVCKTRDAGRDLARAYVRAHLAVFVTPVTFGGYSSELKKALDRMICVELPFFTRRGGEVHHRPRYARRPALLVVGVLREPAPAQERLFHEIARRNAMNLQSPVFAARVLVAPAVEDRIEPHLRGAIATVVERSAGARARVAAGGPP